MQTVDSKAVSITTNNSFAAPKLVNGFIDLTQRILKEETPEQAVKPQQELADTWQSLIPEFPSDNIHVFPSIEHSVKAIRGFSSSDQPVQVLVTGSLHLVGGVIEVAGLSDLAL